MRCAHSAQNLNKLNNVQSDIMLNKDIQYNDQKKTDKKTKTEK